MAKNSTTDEYAKADARVRELLETISAATEELKTIRASCPHPSYVIVNWLFERPNVAKTRMCERCRNHLPGITEAERKSIRGFCEPEEGDGPYTQHMKYMMAEDKAAEVAGDGVR